MVSAVTAQLEAIRSEHVRSAIEEIKRSGFPPAHESRSYHLIYEGISYPQKYIASLATRYATGSQLLPSEFSATQSLPILKSLGFNIQTSITKGGGPTSAIPFSSEVIGDIYYFSKEIYEGNIKPKNALTSLHINAGTARDCFRIFRQMRRGDAYQRTMNAEATDYFLEHINLDYGLDGLRLALQAVDKHLRYYETLGSGSQRKISALRDKYAAIAASNSELHEITGSYTGESPSFRLTPTATLINLSVAGSSPDSALSGRDKCFLSDIWDAYGMDEFQRKNMDAGNIHRALARGFMEYVSGDPAAPQCMFQLTAKARMLLESHESLYLNEVGSQTAHTEGEVGQAMRTIFKRNPNARADCLKYHGYRCKACGFDFEKTYGRIGREYIHVHHRIEISSIGTEYVIDPINDLVPVCPNCHAMLHQKRPAIAVEDLAQLIADAENGS